MELISLEASTLAVTGIWASTPQDTAPFSSTRTLVLECHLRPDTPRAARHGESWNVMPAVWSWQVEELPHAASEPTQERTGDRRQIG